VNRPYDISDCQSARPYRRCVHQQQHRGRVEQQRHDQNEIPKHVLVSGTEKRSQVADRAKVGFDLAPSGGAEARSALRLAGRKGTQSRYATTCQSIRSADTLSTTGISSASALAVLRLMTIRTWSIVGPASRPAWHP
jgi:hypothetical protein